jgi:ParB-like chromosome segregation protein Spo0J
MSASGNGGRRKYQLFDPLPDEEFEGLKEDIRINEVLVPIELDEAGEILDGHERQRACDALRIKDVPTVVRTGMTEREKRLHVRTFNTLRRHLNRRQKRKIIAAQLRETPELSDHRIAASLASTNKTVASVREEMEEREEIPRVESTTDTLGRQQPRKRKPKTGTVTDAPTSDRPVPEVAVERDIQNTSPPVQGAPDESPPAGLEHALSRSGDLANASLPETTGTPEDGYRGGTVFPAGAEPAERGTEEEPQWCLLPWVTRQPFPDVAHRMAELWLSQAEPKAIEASLAEHVDVADRAEVVVLLVSRDDFDVSQVVQRMSDDERSRSASAFQGAVNKLRPRRKTPGAESSSEPMSLDGPVLAAPGGDHAEAGDV